VALGFLKASFQNLLQKLSSSCTLSIYRLELHYIQEENYHFCYEKLYPMRSIPNPAQCSQAEQYIFPNIALRQSAKENTDLSIKKADWEHIASFCAVLQPW
jgi:hypothetical protein